MIARYGRASRRMHVCCVFATHAQDETPLAHAFTNMRYTHTPCGLFHLQWHTSPWRYLGLVGERGDGGTGSLALFRACTLRLTRSLLLWRSPSRAHSLSLPASPPPSFLFLVNYEVNEMRLLCQDIAH